MNDTNPAHYIDNETMFRHYVESREAGKISEQLYADVLTIAQNFIATSKYASFDLREDFVMETILNFSRRWKSFDPTKTNQIFSYVTTMTRNSAIAVLRKENRQTLVVDNLKMSAGHDPRHNFDG